MSAGVCAFFLSRAALSKASSIFSSACFLLFSVREAPRARHRRFIRRRQHARVEVQGYGVELDIKPTTKQKRLPMSLLARGGPTPDTAGSRRPCGASVSCSRLLSLRAPSCDFKKPPTGFGDEGDGCSLRREGEEAVKRGIVSGGARGGARGWKLLGARRGRCRARSCPARVAQLPLGDDSDLLLRSECTFGSNVSARR